MKMQKPLYDGLFRDFRAMKKSACGCGKRLFRKILSKIDPILTFIHLKNKTELKCFSYHNNITSCDRPIREFFLSAPGPCFLSKPREYKRVGTMTAMMETCLIIALSFAVFSAVATVGASLALGIGFERLRAGYEVIRKQTGYFSDQIYRLDKRVETLERDDRPVSAEASSREVVVEDERPSTLTIDNALIAKAKRDQATGVSFDSSTAPAQRLLLEGDFRPEGIRFH